MCVCVVVPKHSREGFRLYLLFVKCRKEQGDKIGRRSLNVCQDKKIWLCHCFNMLSFSVRVEFPDYTGEQVEPAADNTYM